MRNAPATATFLLSVLIAVGGTLAEAGEPPAKIHGRVVLDAGGNGQNTGREQGLAGIAVTDGVQFVLTGADGSYELTVADDPVLPFRPTQTVAISWPNNYWPASPWWRRLADIPADGRLDFALRADQQKLPVTFAHATDPHNSFGGEFSRLWSREIGRMGSRVKLAFVTGDLGYAGIKDVDTTFPLVRHYSETFPVPMFHTVGNHDIVGIHTAEWNTPTELHGNGAFTKHINPIRWSFNYAGIHFVGLDWAYRVGKTLQCDGIEQVAADWLERDLSLLKQPARIYLFIHCGYDKTGRLAPILVRHKVELVVAGHSHRNVNDVIDGVPYIMTANFAGPYRLVTVAEQGYQIVNRCMGCKHPGRKHRLTSFSYPITGGCRVAIPNLEPRRMGHTAISDRVVDSAEAAVGDLKAQRLEAAIRVEPGTARSWGLRIGPDAQGHSIELTATADELRCGNFTTDPAREPNQKNDTWHLALDDQGLSVWANEHAQFDFPFVAGSPVGVTLLTRGGTAKFAQADVWELKSGPSLRRYREKH